MNNNASIALALAGGYLLGRTKKLKFAVGMASMLTGKKLDLTPKGLVKQLGQLAKENPEIARLQNELVTALRDAAVTTATQRLSSISEQLRTGETIAGKVGSSSEEENSDEGDQVDQGESDGDDQPEEHQDQDQPEDQQEKPAKKAAPKKKASTDESGDE